MNNFNSTVVQLEGKSKKIHIKRINNFNSTVVQLEDS